jgi:hypothetical protein
MWLWSARLGERSERRYPDRYRVVRYESLVADPAGVMATILEFVGEAPVSGLVRGDDDTVEESPVDGVVRSSRFVGTASVGRFRTVLPDRDIMFLQVILEPAMGRFGYRVDTVEIWGLDRIRFVVWDIPLNLARMVAWRSGMEVRERLGHRPSTRRLMQ